MNTNNGRKTLPLSIVLLALVAPARAAQIDAKAAGPLQAAPVNVVKPVELPTNLGVQIPQLPDIAVPAAGVDPALTLPAPLATPGLAAPRAELAAPGAPQATAATLARISAGISNAAEAMGPVGSASAGSASAFGDAVQRALQGDDSGAPPSTPPGDSGSGQTPEQNEKLRQLKQVVSIFTEHYAPIEWKQAHRNVDFMSEYQKLRAEILAKPAMTTHQFQQLLADFVASAEDYHASITFFSTEKATLPLMILNADGKHYIAYVDRGVLPKAAFPYEPGDEVVAIDGKPVARVAAAFTKFPNTAETDARFDAMKLTKRSRRGAVDVPQGDVTFTIKTADGRVRDAVLAWDYTPEIIPQDAPHRGGPLGPETVDPLGGGLQIPASLAQSPREAVKTLLRKFVPSMESPLAGPWEDMAASDPDNGFMIGGKKSFVPDLGKVVWELPPDQAAQIPFVVKIYEDARGARIGYVRIPDYMGGGNTDAATQLFEKIVEMFDQKTDGLVIDQVNNPGGNMMYMNDLLSMLTDKPLKVPQHRLMIDESDGALAAQILQQAKDPGMAKDMEEVLQELLTGFMPDQGAMMKGLVDYAEFILSELKAGRRLTNPTNIFGVGRIEPNRGARYTKPIIVLINELDFSAADFFASIMQDNHRATLFGVRTAGAGGAVKDVELPNQYGIEALAYTWTIAIRPIGKPIENAGVSADVPYQITADDLRAGFSGYGKALGELIVKLIKPGTAAQDDPAQDPAPRPRTPRQPRPGPRRPRAPRPPTDPE